MTQPTGRLEIRMLDILSLFKLLSALSSKSGRRTKFRVEIHLAKTLSFFIQRVVYCRPVPSCVDAVPHRGQVDPGSEFGTKEGLGVPSSYNSGFIREAFCGGSTGDRAVSVAVPRGGEQFTHLAVFGMAIYHTRRPKVVHRLDLLPLSSITASPF